MPTAQDAWAALAGASTSVGLATATGTVRPFTSIFNQSAVYTGTVLDSGCARENTTMAVSTSAGVTAGFVALLVSQDGYNFFTAATVNTNTANSVFAATVTGAWRYSAVSITTAITGGTVSATLASV